MVRFSKEGSSKLLKIAEGALTIGFTGSIAENAHKLSVVLTKLNYLTGSDNPGVLRDGVLGFDEPTETINLSGLFEYFGVTHVTHTIPDEAISSRNLGFLYHKELGECALYDSIANQYITNDGFAAKGSLGATPIRKEYFQKFMPDLYKEHKRAEKEYKTRLKALDLQKLTEGSKVTIIPYQELAEKYGELIWVVDENEQPKLVEASDDPYAMRIIKGLKYPKPVADYYDGKTAIVVSIDTTRGLLELSIDGTTKHDKYIEDGSVISSNESQVFTLEHIRLVEVS